MLGKRIRWALGAALLGAIAAVSLPRTPEPPARGAPSVAPPVAGAVSAPAPRSAPNPDADPCGAEIERIRKAPALPGAAPNGGELRVHVVARARSEPVVFERPPAVLESLSPLGAELRNELFTSARPYEAFSRVFRKLKGDRALAREVLLTDGYLYVESPELAVVFVNSVMLSQLFRDPEIVVERGAERTHARRRPDGDYEYTEGPELGQRVKLWLFDRVWAKGGEAPRPLHWAVRPLQLQLGFDRLKIQRITEQGIWADLRYGDTWVPSVLEGRDRRLSLRCERLGEPARSRVAEVRSIAARRERVLDRLRAVIAEQVDEALPFDEPKTEEGQQDGKLRPEWRTAYRQGQDRFTFNDDRYYVFDRQGRPRVPQVCIDFITDTLERASGTWWLNRSEGRERRLGRLRFDQLGIDNHRSVERFLVFAASRPDWFDVYDLEPTERVPFRYRTRFYNELYRHADRYIPGDIVTILGLRDDEKFHYHSFFIFDADPVTGVPTAVAANAGQPRVRSIENEMSNAPRRSILSRVRPRLEWLESIIDVERSAAADEPRDARAPG